MRAFATLALSCFMLSSAPAIAKDAKPADPDKKICRHTETTGSILGGKRVCHTKTEWAQIDEVNAQSARTFSDQVRSGLGTPR